MKRILALATVMVMVAAASVTAETVNLGIVTMEKAEVERIQGLIDGSQSMASETPAVEKPAEVNLGLVKMDADELVTLQGMVSGEVEFTAFAGSSPRADLVNVGLVEMEASDLQALQHMVRAHFKDGAPLLEELHLSLND